MRALAGDELEHFWHLLMGEILPAASAALQALGQLLPPQPGGGEAWGEAWPLLTVVVHNPGRPWGASPLHRFYDEVFN